MVSRGPGCFSPQTPLVASRPGTAPSPSCREWSCHPRIYLNLLSSYLYSQLSPHLGVMSSIVSSPAGRSTLPLICPKLTSLALRGGPETPACQVLGNQPELPPAARRGPGEHSSRAYRDLPEPGGHSPCPAPAPAAHARAQSALRQRAGVERLCQGPGLGACPDPSLSFWGSPQGICLLHHMMLDCLGHPKWCPGSLGGGGPLLALECEVLRSPCGSGPTVPGSSRVTPAVLRRGLHGAGEIAQP